MGSAEMVVAPTPEYKSGEQNKAWRSLLVNNQYEQVKNCLEDAYVQAVDVGDAQQAALLAAAKQLCASCVQMEEEIAFHEQAYHQSETRRGKLDGELKKLLGIMQIVPETSVASIPSPPAIRSRPHSELSDESNQPQTAPSSIWQRVVHFINKRDNSRSLSQPIVDTPVVDTSVTRGPDLLLLPKGGHENQINLPQPEHKTPPLEKQNNNLTNLTIYCLGAFRVYQNNLLINDWNGLKCHKILKYLVTYHNKPVAKDVLMDVFWPDADAEAARRNLHQAIYSLRQKLKEHDPDFQHILYENDCYLFNPELNIWIDFREFEKHVQNGRQLLMLGQQTAAMSEFGIAEGLFQSNFMSEDLYEEWLQPERERLQNLYLDIADCLSNYYLEQQEFTITIALCQKILRQDNCFEKAYFQLMRCYQAQGQRHMAIRYYLSCKETLENELGLLPAAETVELYHELIA